MKFYGQHNLDEFLYKNYFIDKTNGIFVECGAFDGLIENTCKFFEETLNWQGMNIEPVPYAFNKLKTNRPKSVNINCALSNVSTIKKFTNIIHPTLGHNFGNGSLSHAKWHKDQLLKAGCKEEIFDIECKKFSELFPLLNRPIDLFVLDVEGHELEALSGILELDKQYLPKVFCIEYPICTLEKLNQYLNKLYIQSKLYQHNAIFIKK